MAPSDSDPQFETRPETQFETLIDFLRLSRGFDFSGYKRSSLIRRVNKRMQESAVQTYGEYIEYLEQYPDEFLYLFNTLLINVIAFFRDVSAWDYLIGETIPRILAHKDDNEPIRIWSAGCASGEEPYTLIMALAEALGPEQLRSRVKIYATDVDNEALSYARQAAYLPREVDGIRADILDTYFELTESTYRFRKDLRRSVIFGRHDLIQDPPISKIDLLVCRNTLMYFNAATQAKILARFHFALRDFGCLFLGKAEMLLTHTHLFAPNDLKRRIFIKVPRANRREQLLGLSAPSAPPPNPLPAVAFESSPLAQIVIEPTGLLFSANAQAVWACTAGSQPPLARFRAILSSGRTALLH